MFKTDTGEKKVKVTKGEDKQIKLEKIKETDI